MEILVLFSIHILIFHLKELKLGSAAALDESVFKDIKERMCYVARDYYVDVNGPTLLSLEEKSYELPDGNILEITNSQRYKPTEILFKYLKYSISFDLNLVNLTNFCLIKTLKYKVLN